MQRIKNFLKRFNNPLFRIIFIILVLVVLLVVYFGGGKKIMDLINKPKVKPTEEQAKEILVNIAPPEPTIAEKEIQRRLDILKKLKTLNTKK